MLSVPPRSVAVNYRPADLSEREQVHVRGWPTVGSIRFAGRAPAAPTPRSPPQLHPLCAVGPVVVPGGRPIAAPDCRVNRAGCSQAPPSRRGSRN